MLFLAGLLVLGLARGAHIPFELIYIPHAELKGDSYTKVDPNGRLPAVEDPNTCITISESGAIIEYLISEYDPNHKISFPVKSKEDYPTKQWLFFQVSGQDPYYGQGSVRQYTISSSGTTNSFSTAVV
jgi:glutathione S-transferase